MAQTESWQTIADKKQAEQAARIPKEWLLPASYRQNGDMTNLTDLPRKCGMLSKRELELTEQYDATELLSLLRTGRLKSREVVEAFCKVATTPSSPMHSQC
jgi:amidase